MTLLFHSARIYVCMNFQQNPVRIFSPFRTLTTYKFQKNLILSIFIKGRESNGSLIHRVMGKGNTNYYLTSTFDDNINISTFNSETRSITITFASFNI